MKKKEKEYILSDRKNGRIISAAIIAFADKDDVKEINIAGVLPNGRLLKIKRCHPFK